MSQCKSCGAAIKWAKTKEGKAMPIDPNPTRDGNVRLLADGTCEVMILTEAMLWDGPKYKSHFATCPNSAEHRRKRQ